MKKIVRLTESDLHRIVKKSVNRVLRESQGNITWDEFFNNKYFKQLDITRFENFVINDWVEEEELTKYNQDIESFVDEESGDVSFIIRGGESKVLGVPCSSIFEGDDGQIMPYLWSLNDTKTAHAVDINGNVISPEFVGIFDVTDVELLLDKRKNIYISASWVKSDTARKFISKPLCKFKDVIGFKDGLGITLFFRSGRDIKWVNLHSDITTVHSAPINGYIPLSRLNDFDIYY